jgi:hypothetical protein
LGGLLRQATFDAAPAFLGSESELNWGVQIAGGFRIGKRLRAGFAAYVGDGMQGYLANAGCLVGGTCANAIVPNAALTSFALVTTFGWGAYGWLRWQWTDTLRSTIAYSYYLNDLAGAIGPIIAGIPAKAALTGGAHWGQSLHVNLIWSPVPQVNIGIEYLFSHAGIYNFADAQYHAIQIAFQYKF